jgi:DNA-binding response OmpR family regulator
MGKPAKIAVIEDDQTISEMYRLKFELDGYQVETAENGKLGLELVKEMQPDVTLLDIMMPEMNGDEVLAKMRASDWGKDLKVIILTNQGEQEIPASIKTMNVSAVVLKSSMTPHEVSNLIKARL